MTEGILTPEQVLFLVFNPEQCKEQFSERVLKHVESFVCGNIVVWDVKLKVKGYEEEKFFAGNLLIRTNVRRGNSLMLFLNRREDNEVKLENVERVEWVRRGIIKFFDLSLEQINKVLGKSGKSVVKHKKKNKKKGASKEQIHFLTFNEIEISIDSGKSIEIYLTEKANGENVQVSYINHLQKWIISSKNCSIVLSGLQDLSSYSTDRYKFVQLIANCFFSSILPNIPDTESLKVYLQGKTMIGEFIGNKDFQHIVKYTTETIKFYAIVENSSNLPCIPVPEAFYIFEKFNLPRVKLQKIGSFSNKIELFKSIKTVFKSISTENIDQGGEGAVLYFVESREIETEVNEFVKNKEFDENFCEDFKGVGEKRRTLALAKVKTVEYRILRKIREKVKTLGEGQLENSIRIFEGECKELLGVFGLDEKVAGFVEHFRSVAEAKLRKKSKKGVNLNELIGVQTPTVFLETSWASCIDQVSIQEYLGLEYNSNRSITKFLDGHIYHNIISKNNKPLVTNAYYFISGFDENSEQKFFNYIHSCKKTEDFPTELQGLTRKKDLTKLNKKIHEYYNAKRKLYKDISFSESVRVYYIKAENDSEILRLIKNELNKNQKKYLMPSNSIPACLVFFSVSLPGSGKTFMNNYFSSTFQDRLQYQYKYIDFLNLLNDHTSSMDNIKQNINTNEICKKYLTQFIKDLKEEISNFVENNQKILVVYIENNFSYEDFKYVLKNLRELGKRVKAIAVQPKSSEFHLAKNLSFIVSPIFILVCLKRKMLTEIQEQTSIDQILNEMIKIFERLKELNVKGFKCIKDEFDECIQLPMINENQGNIDCDFIKLLMNVIQDKAEVKESTKLIYEILNEFKIEERDFINEFKTNIDKFLSKHT